MYPSLPKSYKNIFPFRIGSTSFIYPDDYEVNVKMLAPFLDEIELLMLESSPGSLPSKHQIKTLVTLANEFDISYNIHLPTDIFLGDHDPNRRQYAIDTIKRVIDLTHALPTSTYTLHLSCDGNADEQYPLKTWQKTIFDSMKQLMSADINRDGIAIENLLYPFEWIEDIVETFKLSVCLDIGHLILQNVDIESFFKTYQRKVSIIHLYGVESRHEHLSLVTLPEKYIKPLLAVLKRFSGVVSLEVFSYDHLKTSLDFLERCWSKTL